MKATVHCKKNIGTDIFTIYRVYFNLGVSEIETAGMGLSTFN